MAKYLFSFFFLFLSQHLLAQDTTLTLEERTTLDSMLKNDEFLKLLGESKGSYVDLSIGLSNGIFSLKNNSLNAGQAEVKKIFFTPSAAYYHKTGLGISLNGFLATDMGRLKTFQYAINPSYSYFGKKIMAGISYTRYIKGSATSFDISPYKNDLYANMVFKKPWVRPAIALGYATGKIIEYFDTSFLFTPFPNQDPRIVHIRDTITTRLASFSVTGSISHSWDFEKLIFKDDAIELQPSVSLNAGSQKWNISHSNSLYQRRPIVQSLLRAKYGNGNSSAAFELQSAAFLLDITYSIGKLNILPQLYLDYYFPETTGKKFSLLYSFVVSYAF